MQPFRAVTALFAFSFLLIPPAEAASAEARRALQMEEAGDAAGARQLLLNAVQAKPNDLAALTDWAEFLDHYHDLAARDAYRKWLALLPAGSADAKKPLRRLVCLDLIEGDRTAFDQDLAAYKAAGGTDLGTPAIAGAKEDRGKFVDFPGPLRSFARMAAISPDAGPDEVLPALGRNVVTNGYQASRSNDVMEQTEFLKLLVRYVSQARELDKFAGPNKVIRIENCESAQTGELLRIVGFRMRGGCGSDLVLETVNASRAFLTTDSGFPMAEFEQALRTNRAFEYDYHPAKIYVLYGPDYWLTAKEKGTGDFLDAFLSDPSICRFYLSMAKLDRGTADALKAGATSLRLRSYAHVLDFFGGMFEIRNGHAATPGGQRAAAAWAELIGASPDNGAQFFQRLIEKDDGWTASYYDAIARIQGPVQDYLCEPSRLKRFYNAVRGQITSPGPARPVFRANADMMLLTTRLRLDPNGRPHIPGGVGVWRSLFSNHPRGKYDSKLSRSATSWNDPDEVLEALFALSRKSVENEPLRIFMAVSEIERFRSTPLAPATVERLARQYRDYGPQYSVFAESPAISDGTIGSALDAMDRISHVRDVATRQDIAGSYQALVGLWQIFCRQGAIPASAADKALADVVTPFLEVRGQRELFDASRNGVKALLTAAGPYTGGEQERVLTLLAGVTPTPESEIHDRLVKEMQRVLDAQRIVSVDNLFAIVDGLQNGGNAAAVQKLAAKVGELQLPRAPLTGVERNALAFGYWTEKHIESQRRLNLRAAIEKAGNGPDRADDLKAVLAPMLRDTLVAYNYAHYAPPGAQILYTNPLFVRGHDFVGSQAPGHTWKNAELIGTGWPSNGGGRLVGSLANLPYALAEAEQNFLIPSQTQALIWADLVPQMLQSAKVPRWWTVTPVQTHWVGLNMRLGAALVAEAAVSPDLRQSVVEALRPQASPARLHVAELLLSEGQAKEAIDRLTPLELYVLGLALQKSPAAQSDPAALEIQALASTHAGEVSDEAISRAFGTPKPTLANSYRPELLKLRTFPTLMGYSSRIMAESWESNTLFWASLADQMHLAPEELNVRIPEWTERVVERIFASHLEDWPALLKSLRLVGDDIRSGKVSAAGTMGAGN
jgi:hypothetical protein